MQTLTSDFEVTTWNKGNPYDTRNFPVCVGMKWNSDTTNIYFHDDPTWEHPFEANLFVFFNAKFDLAWWRKCGQDISGWKIWCCQVAEFLLGGQTTPYPSLNDAAIKYGFPLKHDVVYQEYWSKGVNTCDIPKDILSEYCGYDVDLTYQVYLKQRAQLEAQPKLYQTFKVWMQDLVVLQEIEWNGQIYNESICLQRAEENDQRIKEIVRELEQVYPEVSINFNSGQQLSAFLYGGTIYEASREAIGFFKSGARAGEVKYRNTIIEHQLPRLVEPLKNSEMAKEGIYATDEGTLRKLRGRNATKYVGSLLEYARLEKLNSTYYRGLSSINREMHWPERHVHGQYNQCVAATGRLSSSKPNAQNFAGDILDVFVSRYDGETEGEFHS